MSIYMQTEKRIYNYSSLLLFIALGKTNSEMKQQQHICLIIIPIDVQQ